MIVLHTVFSSPKQEKELQRLFYYFITSKKLLKKYSQEIFASIILHIKFQCFLSLPNFIFFLQLKLSLSHFLPLNNLYSGDQFPHLGSWASISSTADCFCLLMKLGAERWSVVFLLEWQVLIQYLHNLCFFSSKDWERRLVRISNTKR